MIPFTVGLSLGQLGAGEPTAIAIVEMERNDEGPVAAGALKVRHLERFEPGVSTSSIAAAWERPAACAVRGRWA